AMSQRLGPAAAEEPRLEHFVLLRGALQRTGGREDKSLGDGLMVVFDGAAQSLACAVQMQQAVEARNRRAEEKLGAVRRGACQPGSCGVPRRARDDQLVATTPPSSAGAPTAWKP